MIIAAIFFGIVGLFIIIMCVKWVTREKDISLRYHRFFAILGIILGLFLEIVGYAVVYGLPQWCGIAALCFLLAIFLSLMIFGFLVEIIRAIQGKEPLCNPDAPPPFF